MSDPSNPPRIAIAPLARLVVWGLGLRVVAADLVQWYCGRKGTLCVFPDANIYWALAGRIARGEPYEVIDYGDLPHFALRTPGYPLFLALCRLAFGARLLPVRLVQAALGAWCVWLVARLVEQALPRAGANPDGSRWSPPLIAAAVAAFDPFVVVNSAFVLSEALFLPLMLTAQLGLSTLWDSGDDRPRPTPGLTIARALMAGAVLGAAVLVRPSWALYVPAALVVWVALSARKGLRTESARALLVALASVVVMLPWWARNERVFGRFVPTALWEGASLYDGLSPRATGASDMRFLADPEFWPLDEEAQDAVLKARALAFARANPRRALHLAVIKAARFWSPWPNAETFFSPSVAVISALITVPQLLLMALGAWSLRRDPRALALLGLPLLYTFALHLVFVSSMRYRIPVAVPALGLAVAGLRMITWARSGKGPMTDDRGRMVPLDPRSSSQSGYPGGPLVLGRPSVGVTRVLDGLLSGERISVAELLEARMVLEGAAAHLAARPGAELGPVEEAYRAMEQAPDFTRFVEADTLFHRRVAEVGGNRLLVVILTALRDPIVRLISEGLSGETETEGRAKVLHAHGEILKAIRANDGAAADRCSRRHLLDLYASLVAPEERLRLEALLG